MSRTRFAQGEILFREGDPADGVFRLLSGTIDVIRELDGDLILLGSVGAGQFIGEMGVLENRSRSATARAASEVQAEFLAPDEFLEQIASSPRDAREFILRLSQRLREADDRIVAGERQSGRTQGHRNVADNPTVVPPANSVFLIAKTPWLQQQLNVRLEIDKLPFVIGRRAAAEEGAPLRQPDLALDDAAPFRLSRNHFLVEHRDRGVQVRDLGSTLGTIVNGEPIGHHFRTDDASLRTGDNEVIAGGIDSPFAFSVLVA